MRLSNLFIRDIDILRQLHVLEHPLELAREPSPALLLQLTEHRLLGVHRGRLAH